MNDVGIGEYKRVQKRTANNLHKNGDNVYITAVNMRPDSMYMPAVPISLDSDFDASVNAFEYCNCNNECGYYAAFYVK